MIELKIVHETSEFSRTFDVRIEQFTTIHHSPVEYNLVVVAESFEQASAAAVDIANRNLASLQEEAKEAGHWADHVKKAVSFTAEHIVKMETVRSNVAVFRKAA